MKIEFEGTLSEVRKEMQDFINQTNVEPVKTYNWFELTGDREDWVSVRDLKERCNELGVNYRKLRYDYNLLDTRIRRNSK